MVTEILGVVKLVPVPTKFPPVEASYQFMVPAEAVADKTTDPVPQTEAWVVVVMLGISFMVATTAVLAEVQPLSVVST